MPSRREEAHERRASALALLALAAAAPAAAFKLASEACDLYSANRKIESPQQAAASDLALARQVGTDLPDELAEKPTAARPE